MEISNKKQILKIKEFEVNFPFTPYKCQEEMIEKFLESFKFKQNLILESPTGTGKCMSALASCFAFLNDFNSKRINQNSSKLFDKYKDIISQLVDLKMKHFKKKKNDSYNISINNKNDLNIVKDLNK